MTLWKQSAIAAFTAASLILMISSESVADALKDQTDLKNKISGLFVSGKFAELEAMSARFRKAKERNAAGRWQLSVFHDAFIWAFRNHRKKIGDNTYWDKTDAKMKKWIAAYPQSPTPHLAYSRFLLNRGWDWNVTLPASKQQKPKDRERFLKFTGQARHYLEETKAVAAADPNWYRLMVEIAFWQKWPEPAFRELTEEAFDREPLFYQTYLAAARYYAPEDDGNANALEAFARDALRRTETHEGATLYARIYWHISNKGAGERLFLDTNADWGMMKRGIVEIMDDYPDNWNVHNFAKFACLAGDAQAAFELLTHMKGKQVSSNLMRAWRRPSLFTECHQKIKARPWSLKEYTWKTVWFLMQ